MANVFRWRNGDTRPVTLPVASATVVEIGDLVVLDSDEAKPVSSVSYGGSLAAAQENGHDVLVGVAMQASPDGSSDPIRIATAGMFEFDCATASFSLGDRMGIDDNVGGDTLENQKLVGVAAGSPQLSIGRCSQAASSSTTVVLELHSTVLRDGPQAVE